MLIMPRLREIKKQLHEMKQKCSDLEAQIDKMKSNEADVLAASVPLSFEDVV